MNLNEITPLIITWNEAPNIERTLSMLAWAREIVIIDSGSTDETLSIIGRFSQARVVTRAFDSFAGQCNFGLQQIKTEWVLSLDADYVITEGLPGEMRSLDASAPLAGYKARFVYCIHGRPLRASLYPPRAVLYRRRLARYEDDGHGHRVKIEGDVGMLSAQIQHDDRKPLDRWFSAQMRYAGAEAAKLAAASPDTLNFADRIRSAIWCAPWLVFFHVLFVRGLILDGWPGWFYASQRLLAELVLSLRLMEAGFQRKPPTP